MIEQLATIAYYVLKASAQTLGVVLFIGFCFAWRKKQDIIRRVEFYEKQGIVFGPASKSFIGTASKRVIPKDAYTPEKLKRGQFKALWDTGLDQYV